MPFAPRVGDEVPHHQEVAGEAHLRDDAELVAQPLHHPVGRRPAVAGPQALERQVLEVGIQGEAGGHLIVRQVELAEGQLQVAPLRHRQRVAARLGQLAEHLAHLIGGLEVELLGGEAPAVGIGQRGAGLDAEQGLVGLRVRRLEVVGVVGTADGRAQRLRDAERPRRHPRLFLDPVRLDLHEVVIAPEDVLVPARHLLGLGVLAGGEELAHLGVEAAGQNEEPVGVLGEELAIHPRLVVEALEIGLGHELDQVPVAGLVANEHGAVAGALVAAVLARALEAAARRHVELAAHDGLDARLLRRGVEVDRTEEVAVIREGDGGEAQRLRGVHQLVELGGPVEEAVLGVDVQVDEVPPRSLLLLCLYSHSMVLGGLEEMSRTTRLTPFTSLMMRLEIRASRS